jgi:hypothetical protein
MLGIGLKTLYRKLKEYGEENGDEEVPDSKASA